MSGLASEPETGFRDARGPSRADVSVQATGMDAIVSKFSAEKKGYFQDPFLKYFAPSSAQRRAPLINRGYYARFKAIDTIVHRFLSTESSRKHQIVVLGGGVDTLFFRLAANDKAFSEKAAAYDIDFKAVTKRKIETITTNEELRGLIDLPEGEMAGLPQSDAPDSLHSTSYHVIPADLRDLPHLTETLQKSGIDGTAPTLFLSECVLVYMKAQFSDALISWAGKNFNRGVFVTYEQILPNTQFGRVMIQNIERRGCPLHSIHKYPTLISLEQRYTSLGWSHCTALDMNQVYYDFLPKEDVVRVQRIELFDELEEWHLIQGHYSISVAINDDILPQIGSGVAGTPAMGSEMVKSIAFTGKKDSPPPWFNKYR